MGLSEGAREWWWSHQSAAALLRIPLLGPDRSSVHFTSASTGRTKGQVQVHRGALPAADLVVVTTTTIAGTVCDGVAQDASSTRRTGAAESSTAGSSTTARRRGAVRACPKT
ncbi:MAG: hypothetical protein QM662_13515 [Gordonia sp. (in: high G+C Gram-positive bacteria)]